MAPRMRERHLGAKVCVFGLYCEAHLFSSSSRGGILEGGVCVCEHSKREVSGNAVLCIIYNQECLCILFLLLLGGGSMRGFITRLVNM